MSKANIRLSVRFDGISKFIEIPKHAQVHELFNILRQEVIGNQTQNFTVIYQALVLEEYDEGDIETLGMRNMDSIDLAIKALGGGNRQAKGQRPADETDLSSSIDDAALPTFTTEKCCIFGDDGEEDHCYKMPCGCAYSTMAITSYCNTVIHSDKNFTFSCQVCLTSWSYEAVRYVLCEFMTDDELIKLNEKLNDNYVAQQLTIRRCPTCKNLTIRDFSKRLFNKYCVKCTLCTHRTGRAVEFCWCCLKPWKSKFSNSCGNTGCLGKDPRVGVLKACRTKTIGKVSGVPIIRACVNCSALIQHADKCKHMTCKCGYAFCFVCLKPFDFNTKKWSCGSWRDECPVAPLQTSFFI